MDVRAVSTPWKLLAGFCAASLALAGCDDSSPKNQSDAGSDASATGGGNNNGNNTSDNMDGGGTGDDNTGMMGMPVAMLGDNVAGKACTATTDCEGENTECASMIGGVSALGMTFGAQTAEGGYCTGVCNDDSSCGAGGVCVGALALGPIMTQGSCQKACETDGDCRTDQGYECRDNSVQVPDGGFPGTDGGAGPMVPPQPNTCLPKLDTVMLADGEVGTACATDADCTGGVCTKELMMMGAPGGQGTTVTFPGGYCGGQCQDDANCGAGGVCIGAISLGPVNLPGNCYQACEEQTDCTRTADYACLPTQGFMGAGPSACQPGEAPVGDAGAGDAGPANN